ncbi:Twin-arginine translocation pathway signal [Streptomyces sp. BE133]|uniref:Twin-arginine translocation pathway signal n=1 Tax=Streptomyces sp. BE133 TaxID=3002523 RepID=UPI002E78CA24|nr:Twin-arginine translocation pathway signal [Streptomyces sp. BE133]MEE1811822.1 Twin-arginine translocation pathway signal [Streptomyces sp. BE133]
MRGQSRQHDTARIAHTVQDALTEVSALEAWRFALGWSRSQTVAQVAGLYVADGLLPPGLSEPMLCRWEHDADEWPGPEYTVMLCRAYGAHPEQLGLARALAPHTNAPFGQAVIRYGRPETTAYPRGSWEGMEPMTTAAGLPAVRESLHLALLADPMGNVGTAELAEAAVEHYALNYSKHPPQILFNEVREVRQLLTPVVQAEPGASYGADIQRQVGWLSALLGNLAFHLDDLTGARTHLSAAAAWGERTGDIRLAAWAWGAHSMVARTTGRYDAALSHAERGAHLAPAGLPRAQLHAWALLPALARLQRADDADQALRTALAELEADPSGTAPGRFGFDEPELALHQAEADLALGRHQQARARAEASSAACPDGTGGWTAATLVLAQAEATDSPQDAAQRALHVLDHVPATRLRSTARTRLHDLTRALPTGHAAELTERLGALPSAIDRHGHAL